MNSSTDQRIGGSVSEAEHRAGRTEPTPLQIVGSDGEDLLLLEEISELTRVPVNTLRYLRQNGQGPKMFKVVGRVVARRKDVADWIAQYEQETATGGAA